MTLLHLALLLKVPLVESALAHRALRLLGHPLELPPLILGLSYYSVDLLHGVLLLLIPHAPLWPPRADEHARHRRRAGLGLRLGLGLPFLLRVVLIGHLRVLALLLQVLAVVCEEFLDLGRGCGLLLLFGDVESQFDAGVLLIQHLHLLLLLLLDVGVEVLREGVGEGRGLGCRVGGGRDEEGVACQVLGGCLLVLGRCWRGKGLRESWVVVAHSGSL